MKFGKNKTLRKEALTAFAFLLPTLIIFTVFKYLPMINNFWYSLTSWNLFGAKRFIGFTNYQRIFVDPLFWNILGNSFFYTIFSTLFSIILGFFCAIALYRLKSTWGKIMKTLIFIPNITTASAIAILWLWIFDPDFGLSGQICTALGWVSPRWLTTPKYAMWIIISLSVWRSMGYVMLIFISGLTAINDEIYEAAKIDGAGSFQQLWKITIPLLKPTTVFLIVTSLIQAMQVFDIVSVMTGGGPYNSTNVMNLYIYQKAFNESKAGYASALSVILFLLLLVLTALQQKLTKGVDND